MGQLSLSENTHLRLLEEADAAELHSLIGANRDHLAQWLPWAAGQRPADTAAFLRRARMQVERNDGFQAAIVEGGTIAGVAGYHGVDWAHRSTSLGYWLAEDSQGRGTMTTAVRVLTEHALLTWGLVRVEIRAALGNRRSRAIPERLGYGQEGTLRRAERVGGRYLDLAVYAMVK